MATTGTVSVEDQQRLIIEQLAAWSAHDIDRLLRLFAADFVYEDVTMGAVNRTTAELRAFGEGFLSGFPDVTFEVRSSFANDANGGAEWVMPGTTADDMIFGIVGVEASVARVRQTFRPSELRADGRSAVAAVALLAGAGDVVQRLRRAIDSVDRVAFAQREKQIAVRREGDRPRSV